MSSFLSSVTLAVVVLACITAPAQGRSSEDPPTVLRAESATTSEATVNRTIAGDSLDAHLFGMRTAVGYAGVETLSPNTPCGQDALQRNRELADGRVLLEEELAHPFDAAGRRLFYAYTADGRSIDEILIREGLGRAVRLDAPYGAYLASVQAEAETARRGCLWAD